MPTKLPTLQSDLTSEYRPHSVSVSHRRSNAPARRIQKHTKRIVTSKNELSPKKARIARTPLTDAEPSMHMGMGDDQDEVRSRDHFHSIILMAIARWIGSEIS